MKINSDLIAVVVIDVVAVLGEVMSGSFVVDRVRSEIVGLDISLHHRVDHRRGDLQTRRAAGLHSIAVRGDRVSVRVALERLHRAFAAGAAR